MNRNRPASSKTQRLFFALWPDIELGHRLYELAGEPAGRRVPPENIHLTLAFLGPVDAAFRQCAEEAAARVRAAAFTLVLERIGCWRQGGILWIGPAQTPPPLSALVQELNAGLSECGYQPERRPYAAHLTVGRNLRRCFDEHPIAPLAWDVRRFCLVQSRTFAQGARYEILGAWELSPPAA